MWFSPCDWALAGAQNLSDRGFPNSEPPSTSMHTQPISCPRSLNPWTIPSHGIEEFSTAEAGRAPKLTLLGSNIVQTEVQSLGGQIAK